jgi:hypothetical protein
MPSPRSYPVLTFRICYLAALRVDNPCGHLACSCRVRFGVDLRGERRPVPQGHPGQSALERFPQGRGDVVPESVQVAVFKRGSAAELRLSGVDQKPARCRQHAMHRGPEGFGGSQCRPVDESKGPVSVGGGCTVLYRFTSCVPSFLASVRTSSPRLAIPLSLV